MFKRKQPKFLFRFEHSSGHFREINLRASSQDEALKLAEQRLGEQFEDQVDYTLASVKRL